jgi:molybdopterin synthase sulfur carrier subunit
VTGAPGITAVIKLLFFGRLGDSAAMAPELFEASEGLTASAVRDALAIEHPLLVEALLEPQVLVSIDRVIADWNQPLRDGCELAFLPPVTGG